jgi:hypothetical protein
MAEEELMARKWLLRIFAFAVLSGAVGNCDDIFVIGTTGDPSSCPSSPCPPS